MVERLFPMQRSEIGGIFVRTRPITCSSCEQPGEIIDRTKCGLPSVQVQRILTAKGWEIGASDKHDLCPKCKTAKRQERRDRRGKSVNGNGHAVVAPEEPKVMHAPQNTIAPSISEQAPPEPTRSEKRIIVAKLEEVYADETAGYKTPWTDAKVAVDLGVPQAWVVAIRDELFGPANDNQEIRDMMERATAAASEAHKLLAEAKSLRAEASALVDRVNAHNKQVAEVGKKLDGMLILAERITRSLKA